jgi:hypothetical protein
LLQVLPELADQLAGLLSSYLAGSSLQHLHPGQEKRHAAN